MLFLDDAEVKKLADAMPDYRVAILTAASAGLRASDLDRWVAARGMVAACGEECSR